MTYQRLEITDGIDVVDLLRGAFGLQEWESQQPDVKGGGIWLDNPLVDGRVLAIRQVGNYIETFTLSISGQTQGEVSRAYVRLLAMLTKATAYFTDAPLANSSLSASQSGKVYLVMQAQGEAYSRYSQIVDYRVSVGLTSLVGSMLAPRPAVGNWPLIIEHGSWYIGDPLSPVFDPTGLCVQIGADRSARAIIEGNQTVIAINTDDCEACLSLSTLNTAATLGRIGNDSGALYGVGLRFRNIPIAPGTVIKSAWLTIPGVFSNNADAHMKITGELVASAATFSTWANYAARVRTSQARYWQFPASGSQFEIYGLEDIVQEIVDGVGWLAGNDLAMFVEDDQSAGNKFFSSRQLDGGISQATLNIELATASYPVNVAKSCTRDVVMVGNYDYPIPLGRAMYYDASTGLYTNIQANGSPVAPYVAQMLPAVPAVGDIIYFSSPNIATGGLTVYPFGIPSNLIFNIDPAAVDITGVWEVYCNPGPNWNAVANFIDYSGGFKNAKVSELFLSLPDLNNMIGVLVNGVPGLWVRFRITAVGAAPTPPSMNGCLFYLASRNYFDIDKDDVQSDDIFADGTLSLNPLSGSPSTPNLTVDELWLCSRSVDRGSTFTPFIPLIHSWYLTLPDVTVNVDVLSLFQWGFSPYGHVFQLTSIGAMAATVFAQIGLQDTALQGYRGQYRAFLRRYYVTTSERVKYRLKISSTRVAGPYTFTGAWAQDTTNPTWDVLDLGVVTLPPAGVSIYELKELWLSLEAESTGAFTSYLLELILLPIDEWWAHVYQGVSAASPSYIAGYAGNSITVDSSSDEQTQVTVQDAVTGAVLYKPTANLSGKLQFRTDKTLRFWTLAGTYTTGCINYRRRWFPAITLGVRARCSGKVTGLAT